MKTKFFPCFVGLACCCLSILSACDHSSPSPNSSCDAPLPLLLGEVTLVDNYQINDAFLLESCLYVQLSHSGGCVEHAYALKWNGALAESMPPQAYLHIEHQDGGDMCEALITKDLFFDLNPLLDTPYSQIVIHINGWGESLLWSE
jgi:hypothetical protein